MAETASGDPLSGTLRAAFAREVRRGVQLAILGNAIVLGLYLAALALQILAKAGAGVYGRANVIASLTSLLGATVLVSLTYALASRSKQPLLWCFVFMILNFLNFLQVAGFGFLPASLGTYPRYLSVHHQDVLSLAFALALFALPLSRAFVGWTVALFIAVYSAAVAISLWHAPDAHIFLGPYRPDAATLRAATDSWTFEPDLLASEMLLLAALALLLILAIGDGRRFVVSHAQAETARAALSRFLPPAVAAHIAARGTDRIAATRRQAAILFVAPAIGGDSAPDLLSLHDFYVRTETILFAHDAVLDRFTGGAVMASFGTLDDEHNATAKALAAAREIARAFAGKVRIGVHCGPVVAGDLGSARSRYFGAVGGAINIARRVLDEAGARGIPIIASDDVVREAQPADGITALGPVPLRGRDTPLALWAVGA